MIFKNRFNGATSILSKDEGYVGKKFEITTSASDSSGFAFVSGVIENYTSALIEYVSTTSDGISEYNRFKRLTGILKKNYIKFKQKRRH